MQRRSDKYVASPLESTTIAREIYYRVVHSRRRLLSKISGAPKTATTEDKVKKVHDLVLADRRLKVREIAETVGISKDCMGHILHEILNMRKLSARWVLRVLTPDNKRNRETTSEQCLTLFKRNPKEFLRSFVTVDETWIH